MKFNLQAYAVNERAVTTLYKRHYSRGTVKSSSKRGFALYSSSYSASEAASRFIVFRNNFPFRLPRNEGCCMQNSGGGLYLLFFFGFLRAQE